MTAPREGLPQRWPADRRAELERLRYLLYQVSMIDDSSGCLARIETCIRYANELTRSDLAQPRESFMQFLVTHATTEIGDEQDLDR